MTDTKKMKNELIQKKLTPGDLYVSEFLSDDDLQDDGDKDYDHEDYDLSKVDMVWLAEQINDGSLIACPRCHFLNLPVRPYPLHTSRVLKESPAVDRCPVCELAIEAAELPFSLEWLADTLLAAPRELALARRKQARTLFDLWMGPSLASDLWVMAEMGQALSRVKELSRTHV